MGVRDSGLRVGGERIIIGPPLLRNVAETLCSYLTQSQLSLSLCMRGRGVSYSNGDICLESRIGNTRGFKESRAARIVDTSNFAQRNAAA